MAIAFAKHAIRNEMNFLLEKESRLFAFGIIRSGKNSIASFRQFGLHWKNAYRQIPHLSPLPLRKGEADSDRTLIHFSVLQAIWIALETRVPIDPSPQSSPFPKGRGGFWRESYPIAPPPLISPCPVTQLSTEMQITLSQSASPRLRGED